jgi:hypothetical protein
MRRSSKIGLALAFVMLICAVLTFVGCRSLSYIHRADERPYDLWMAALKGFEGPVYYVGSDGDYSYFRAGKMFYTRYKAQTSKLGLPRTFPFGKGEPYLVTQDMVYLRQ